MSSFALFPVETPRRPVAAVQTRSDALHQSLSAIPKLAEVRPASRLAIRPAPEVISTGVAAIDAMTGGLPRGCLTEMCGAASSGRTSLLLATLAAATQRQEACALVDACDAFDPASAAAAGLNFDRLLWVRCEQKYFSPRRATRNNNAAPLEQALRVTDLLLQSGGFGIVVLDLGGVPFKLARRIPLASWFRFQRVVEPTPTVLLVLTPESCAKTCAALLLQLRGESLDLAQRKKLSATGNHSEERNFPSHAELLAGFHLSAEVLRSRLPRKPSQSVTEFASRAVRVG
jgi:hypothetical protein